MKKEIFTSEFCSLHIDTAHHICEVQWFPATRNMSNNAYKETCVRQLDAMKEYGVTSIFIDGRSFLYVITPKMQKWVDENIASGMVECGIKKMGILVPEEVFANIGVEQLLGEGNAALMRQELFSEKTLAINWLKE